MQYTVVNYAKRPHAFTAPSAPPYRCPAVARPPLCEGNLSPPCLFCLQTCLPRRWVIWDSIPQLCLPCQREDGRANIYEPAQVGYIFNYAAYRGALFKGSRQVGAIATTCLRVSHFLYIPLSLAMLAVPPCVRGTFYGLNLYLSPFNSPLHKGDKIMGLSRRH